MSTFTTVVTTPVGNLIVVSSVGNPTLIDEVKATASTPVTSSSTLESQLKPTPTKSSGVLPSEIVTDPAVQQKNAQDAPFDINNYDLMTSVNLPMIVGRAAEPTAAV